MTTQRVHVEPDAFAALAGLAAPTPVVVPSPVTAPDHATAPAPGAPASTLLPDTAAGTPSEPTHPETRRGRTGSAALAGAAVVVVVAGALVMPGLVVDQPTTPDRASVAALEVPQQPADVLHPEDVARLAVEAASTRLLLATDAGSHYVARTPSGELCLVRVPTGDLPTEVCVPDRVGADATIGGEGSGQVRLVADGASAPAGADGWRPAGPNVWVRG